MRRGAGHRTGLVEIVRCDCRDIPVFEKVCAHGRTLHVAAGTLTGDAGSDTVAGAEAAGAPPESGPILLSVFLQLDGHLCGSGALTSNLDDYCFFRAQYCSR